MSNSRKILIASALATLMAAGVAGCKPATTAKADPSSANFAALCQAALTVYYVEGGRGPEFDEKSRRGRLWIKRYHERAAASGLSAHDAAKNWKAIYRDLVEAHVGKGIARKNEAMKQIMDACAPHEA